MTHRFDLLAGLPGSFAPLANPLRFGQTVHENIAASTLYECLREVGSVLFSSGRSLCKK